MVIVSHDRMFLDQLCTKIVETERGVTTTFPGNYTQCAPPPMRQLEHRQYEPTLLSRGQMLMKGLRNYGK